MHREPETQQRQGDDARERSPAEPIPPLEWMVAALGALLVVASLLFMLQEAFDGDASPPDIRVVTDSVVAVGSGYLLQARVRNEGSATAADVVIQGAVRGADGKREESQTTIDYVPAHSERHIGLYFGTDPRIGSVELRALGYRAP